MDEINVKKLHWACRRGMLELDVLLGKFLKEAYPGLSQEDKSRFSQLLTCADPELFAWLLGRETPDEPDMAAIVEVIRRHAKS